jgi:galactokinase
VAVAAPGRANLIGEHTDYNDGFVLPVALEVATYIAGRRRAGVLRLRSLQEPEGVEVDLDAGLGPERGWGVYVTAVVRALRDESVALAGLDGVLHSEVPAGSGLSSSASLEVAVAMAVIDEPLERVRLAEICRRAENVHVGVEVGIMDQLASAAGREGHALLIDCRDNSIRQVPVPDSLSLLLVDSAVARGLSTSAYNQRREECRRAARALGVSSLREASLDALDDADLDEGARRRAHHVITENQRVLDAVECLQRGDLARVGLLLVQSHRSLAGDFEVSTPELDALVDSALEVDGVFGARLVGAGFGGCTVNLVATAQAQEAGRDILRRYEARTGRRGRWWVSRPAAGARRLPL